MSVLENVEQAIQELKVSEPEEKVDVSSRIRGFCFTLNNYKDDEVNKIKDFFVNKCIWGIFGYEVGENGTPHLQGALYRQHPITIKGLKKDLGDRCHIEVMHGTYEQNKIYCSKGGNVFEVGECPKQGKRSDIHTIKKMAKEGKGMRDMIDEVNSYQAMRCGELVLKYIEKERDFAPMVMWFYGPTGSGKSYMADYICKQYGYTTWRSNKNLQWFEGYDAHEAVIIDDFRRSFCNYEELLLLLDRYPYRVMNKGGSRQLLAKLIIITCPKSPKDLYQDESSGYDIEKDIDQLLRRINYIVQFPVVKWPWDV